MYLDTALLRSMEAREGLIKVRDSVMQAVDSTMYGLELHQAALTHSWVQIADTVEHLIATFHSGLKVLNIAMTLTTAPAELSDAARNAVTAAIEVAGSQNAGIENARSNYAYAVDQCNEAAGWMVPALDKMSGAIVQPHMTAETMIQEALAQIQSTQTCLDNAQYALINGDELTKYYMQQI
jgi:hypothetical protein